MTKQPITVAVFVGGLLLAGDAAAQAGAASCAPLNRIIAAADANPTWAGVSRGATGTVLPFGFTACQTASYSSSADYNCHADATAGTVNSRHEALVRQIGQCMAGQPVTDSDSISTSTTWRTASGVEVTATRVAQANANYFAVGLTVRRSY